MVFVTVIMCLVGWNSPNLKDSSVKREQKTRTPRRMKEVKIVVVKEKAPKHEKKKDPKIVVAQEAGAVTQKPNSQVKEERVQKKRSAKVLHRESNKKDTNSRVPISASLRLNQAMVDMGRNLINTKSSVPVVLASYDRIGFQSYIKKMKELKGRLFIGDAEKQQILAEVLVYDDHGSFRFSGLHEGKRDVLDGMALFRPREISDDLLVEEALNYASRVYGARDLRCVVLLPLDKEAAILGALKEYLDRTSYRVSEFDLVWGHYTQSASGFALKLEKGQLQNPRRIVSLDLILTM
jgi:hypothetical protein